MVELGAAVKKYRLAKGWTQAELGKAVQLDHTSIAHIERGTRRVPRRDVMHRIDKALGACGAIYKLRDELDDNPDSATFRRYLHGQQKAENIWQICGITMPTMLETAEFANKQLAAAMPLLGGDLNEKVAYRAELRDILHQSSAPTLHVVLHEAALHRVIGGPDMMRAQLLHLVERSRAANVNLRVFPSEGNDFTVDAGFVAIWDRPRKHPIAWRPLGMQGRFHLQRADVEELMRLYDHMRGLALGHEESRTLIHKVVEESYPCAPNIST
ncbi:helix-turn-helix transcriptional regulator [Streptomyces sp. UNOC14_S4]|uniref:helix-turn-helix domain-containing protein n=1 Tax=Streptomyces sp. UNOC14_S4 TaxID=2872340 RepID=UPI001E2B3CA0|nr:helix-turn-helix transcriptional regulator [Streptomyces sp. UNOC14_S4]MCC3770152.1 helix-turn-helix domain-containing protein [Streptomyces sp. UNOC14_S4]